MDGAHQDSAGGATALTALLQALATNAQRPLESSRAMPPRAFCDPDFLALERDAVLAPEWHCVGRHDELVEPGDYVTHQIAEEPVFVIRGTAGQLRAFSNICRHRLAQLLEGRGHVARIVCPYHAWNYDLAGRLKSAPFMPDSFDPTSVCLPGNRPGDLARLGLRQSGPGGPAPGPATGRPGAPHRQLPHGGIPPGLPGRRGLADQLEMPDRELHRDLSPIPRAQQNRRSGGADSPDPPRRGRRHGLHLFLPGARGERVLRVRRPHVSGQRQPDGRGTQPASAFLRFPDAPGGALAERAFWLSLQPLDSERVKVSWGADAFPGTFTEDETGRARAEQFRRSLEAINEEDKGIIAGVRRNAGSRFATSGPLAPKERSLWDFQRYLARRLGLMS